MNRTVNKQPKKQIMKTIQQSTKGTGRIRLLRGLTGMLMALGLATTAWGATYTYDNGYTNLGGFMTLGVGDVMIVSNGAVAVNDKGLIGNSPTHSNNVVVVTGAGSIWSNTATAGGYSLILGNSASSNNSLTIRDGGTVVANGQIPTLGNYYGVSNKVLISGGTFDAWDQPIYVAGTRGSIVVSNGGVVKTERLWIPGMDNTILISGPNSVWTNKSVGASLLGWSSSGNQLILSNGGRFMTAFQVYLGYNSAAGSNNVFTVTGKDSLLSVSSGNGNLWVGYNSGSGNQLIVTNGGELRSQTLGIGQGAGATNSLVLISGTGSLARVASYVTYGTGGGGMLLINDGGTLEANALYSAPSQAMIISNNGGIYQFTTATMTVTQGSANSILSHNGTISFRGIANAPTAIEGTQLTNIVFSGNTGYRLDGASNTSVASYTFNTGSPTNYQQLTLANGGRWRSTTLAVGSGGELNGNGTIASDSVTNNGVIAPGFSPGLITFTSNLVLGPTSDLQMEIGGTPIISDKGER
ncbi:MAG: hypothetical protein IT578_05055 [Verrucomicrobiae bacterium]|nr:hypothetical protein [Verrucomicrobiae bacterium]